MKKRKTTELLKHIAAARKTAKDLPKMLKLIRDTLELVEMTLQNELDERDLNRGSRRGSK
jgi:hypothetical protein